MGEIQRDGNLVKNPNYQVIINRVAEADLPDVTIQANLPESFSFGVTANYEARLPSSVNSGEVAGSIVGAFNRQAGEAIKNVSKGAEVFSRVSRIFQLASHQVWNGSSPIAFSLPLLFDAVEDAEKDVVLPIKQLLSLVLPFRGNTGSLDGLTNDKLKNYLLKPPGPVISNPDYGRVSLQVGNMNYFNSVLITDVNVTFDTRMTKNGAPISASADVSMMTVNTPTQDDIDKFFMSTDKNGNKVKDDTYGVKYAPIEDVDSYMADAFNWKKDENDTVTVDPLGDDDFVGVYTNDGRTPADYHDGN